MSVCLCVLWVYACMHMWMHEQSMKGWSGCCKESPSAQRVFAESLSGPLYVFLLQQFQRIDDDPAKKPLVLAHKRTIEGSTTEVYDLSGPWCDVWSLGVMVLQFCLGSPSQEDKTEVLILEWCLFKEIQTLKNGSVFWLYPYQLCEVTHLKLHTHWAHCV